ncbi:hypothetical protein [uncultured Kordia sp.]|uniref:hypothetical protein n=1 Tax=uncultured Kordia sp. TaxID=507699 RepID=UPI00262B9313|nr:hypothetical protein [uncultured Kordia sp.]
MKKAYKNLKLKKVQIAALKYAAIKGGIVGSNALDCQESHTCSQSLGTGETTSGTTYYLQSQEKTYCYTCVTCEYA